MRVLAFAESRCAASVVPLGGVLGAWVLRKKTEVLFFLFANIITHSECSLALTALFLAVTKNLGFKLYIPNHTLEFQVLCSCRFVVMSRRFTWSLGGPGPGSAAALPVCRGTHANMPRWTRDSQVASIQCGLLHKKVG